MWKFKSFKSCKNCGNLHWVRNIGPVRILSQAIFNRITRLDLHCKIDWTGLFTKSWFTSYSLYTHRNTYIIPQWNSWLICIPKSVTHPVVFSYKYRSSSSSFRMLLFGLYHDLLLTLNQTRLQGKEFENRKKYWIVLNARLCLIIFRCYRLSL